MSVSSLPRFGRDTDPGYPIVAQSRSAFSLGRLCPTSWVQYQPTCSTARRGGGRATITSRHNKTKQTMLHGPDSKCVSNTFPHDTSLIPSYATLTYALRPPLSAFGHWCEESSASRFRVKHALKSESSAVIRGCLSSSSAKALYLKASSARLHECAPIFTLPC